VDEARAEREMVKELDEIKRYEVSNGDAPYRRLTFPGLYDHRSAYVPLSAAL
jgi:hypothetical protein